MKIKVTKDLCEIKENEIWNVGDYNVHIVQVELSPEFNGLVNKVRYFVEGKSYDMLITDNIAQVPYEATVMEGTIKIGVYGYDADTDILVQSTSPVNKYISSGTYTGDPDNTEPLTPTDKEQMQTAIQKNTDDIIDLKANKQDKLISGVNIKTINNESILRSGNLTLVTEETDPIFTNSPAYSITDNDITYWNNKANISDIPDVSNFITKDVDNLTYYTKSTDMQTAINNAVGSERTARENADNSLQNQIDAITVSSDVVDVVSTYQDLVDYDRQHIKANDIIKVMQDSTHDNAISYYRWVIVNHVGSWEYVGSEGPYYTKSETDTLLNAKQNTLVSGQNIKTINNESLLGEGNINIQSGGTSDYTYLTNKPKINNVELVGNKSLNDLGIQPAGNYITKAVNDLENYYTKSETFTKQEVNNLISAITTMDIQVVQTLPVQDISTTTIYLVPKITAETNDVYDEYIYVSNAWEHIGSTEVDLTNYVTKTDYATTTKAGVMSSTDKIKVNEISGYYGTCSTGASTQAKVVVCDNFVLETGAIIYVKFTNAQAYSGTATLNVNSTGAKDIARVGTVKITRYYWTPGELVGFVYDGTNYLMIEKGTATTSYYGLTKLITSATSTSDIGALTPKSLNSFAQGVVADYPVYSTSGTYQVGDRVRYNYGIYECITAIPTAESWTAVHWQELPSLQEQITDINATIGDIDTILTRLTTGGGVS